MKHAILGPGGVGGTIGAALAHSGQPVVFVVRPESAETYPRVIQLESAVLGTFNVEVGVVPRLTDPVNVLWITCKATELEAALRSVAVGFADGGIVIPLLNGIDHVARLRERFGSHSVVPGAIHTNSTRVAAGQFVHKGWHVFQKASAGQEWVPSSPIQLASDGARRDEVAAVAAELESAGIPTQLWPSEGQVIWHKVACVAGVALATSAVGGPVGMVRDNAEVLRHMRRAIQEVMAVAEAVGVELDRDLYSSRFDAMPDTTRISMERDISAGRQPEMENVIDPVIREGRARGVPVPSLEFLRSMVLERVGLDS